MPARVDVLGASSFPGMQSGVQRDVVAVALLLSHGF